MNYILNLFHARNLDIVCRIPVAEVLLQTAAFTRCGRVEDGAIDTCIHQLKKNGKKVTLDFNILITDQHLEMLGESIVRILGQVDAVRFMDPGVGAWLIEHCPNTALHLSLEFGSFNQTAIFKWIEIFGPRLRRIVLSNQIPLSELKPIIRHMAIETELLGCGRIEIFYSARKLIGTYFPKNNHSHLELTCASEDRPDQFSPLLENRHGTIMFYDRDLYILNMVNKIAEIGIQHLRLEFFTDDQYQWLAEYFPSDGWKEHLFMRWKNKTTHGFLQANQTDAILPKRTNRYFQAEQQNKTGIVLESKKNSYIVFELIRTVHLPAKLVILSPEGKRIDCELVTAKTLLGTNVTKRMAPGYYRIPWIKHVVSAAIITCSQEQKRGKGNSRES